MTTNERSSYVCYDFGGSLQAEVIVTRKHSNNRYSIILEADVAQMCVPIIFNVSSLQEHNALKCCPTVYPVTTKTKVLSVMIPISHRYSKLNENRLKSEL